MSSSAHLFPGVVDLAYRSEPEEDLRAGKTLGTALAGLGTRIVVAKITVYTYAFIVNRCLGRTQGRIKGPWA
jgi:hypothetical protein